MRINTRISALLIASFFAVSACMGAVSVVSLLKSQKDNLTMARNEILETSRELMSKSASFFFQILDKKLQEKEQLSVSVVAKALSDIDPGYSNDAIVISTETKKVIDGLGQPKIAAIFDKTLVTRILHDSILMNKTDFYFDNYDDFISGKAPGTVPVAVHCRLYPRSGVIIGYGKILETAKIRIDYMGHKNRRHFRMQLYVLVTVVICATIISALLSMLFLRRFFIVPLNKIGEGVHRVARGELSTRIYLRSRDELGELATAFNEMAQDLQRTTISIEHLLRENDERKRVEEALRSSESDLRNAYSDLKNTQAQLAHSEKMASVGLLAAGVAHEINNPTGFVMSNLEIMKLYAESLAVLFAKYRELEDAISAVDDLRVEEIMTELDILKRDHNIDVIFNDLPMMISESHEGAHRIKRIVSDLRTFSRSDQGELKYVDLHEIIDFSINLVRNELKYKAKVSKEYGDLPRLLCYPQMLGQVIVNLLINAAQAIDSTGDITLRTLFEKDTAVIEISDTGCGMSELVLAHLFEPFFTTKPAGKGTGLGLSLVYSIIEKHRGDIKVKSKVGEGTTFIIRLPVDSAEIV